MKITDMRTYVVEVLPARPWTFVEIDTDAGITGLGECTDYSATAHIVNGLESIRPLVIGSDAGKIEDLWQRVFHGYSNMNGRGYVSKILSAIDIALWDIKGKSLGVPIYDLLGGPVRENIPLYTHAPGAEGGAMARSNVTKELSIEIAVDAVKQGYTAIKTDPFSRGWLGSGATGGDIVEPLSPRLVREAAEWMIEMRRAVGPDIELMVDAHARFDVASAIKAAKALEPANLLWIEEPIPNESVQALRQYRENTNIPLCVGERQFTRWDYMPLLEAGLVDYIMPDVCWTGGISELRRIAAVAEAYYVRFSPHDANGPVVVVSSAHVDITAPNLYRQELVHEFLPHYAKILKRMFGVRDGSMYLDPSEPGLGIELDHEKMEEFVVYSPEERRDKPFRFFVKELSSGGGVAPERKPRPSRYSPKTSLSELPQGRRKAARR